MIYPVHRNRAWWNDEIRMTKDEGMPETTHGMILDTRGLIRHLRFLRHSTFVLRHSL